MMYKISLPFFPTASNLRVLDCLCSFEGSINNILGLGNSQIIKSSRWFCCSKSKNWPDSRYSITYVTCLPYVTRRNLMEIKYHEIKISFLKTTFWSPQQVNLSFNILLLREVLIPEFWESLMTLSLSFTLFISGAPGLVKCTPLVSLPTFASSLLSPMPQ